MLRKGIAFLLLGALCASTAAAADGKSTRHQSSDPGGLIGWLKQKSARSGKPHRHVHRPSPIQQAVVNDAEQQAARVLQTGQQPETQQAAETANDTFVEYAQPLPIEMAPPVPNASSVGGPQYFSATPGNGLSNPVPVTPGSNWQQYQSPLPVQSTSAAPFQQISSRVPAHLMSAPAASQSSGATLAPPSGVAGQYPRTGAPLYPAPRPGIPQQVGGTSIVHPAFQPHEMLYAHQYKAMYPPYYYKVNGGWFVSPFGVWSHENWKLQGTEVNVKYNSKISPFAFFKPPVTR
jgi:hypothetical protein